MNEQTPGSNGNICNCIFLYELNLHKINETIINLKNMNLNEREIENVNIVLHREIWKSFNDLMILICAHLMIDLFIAHIELTLLRVDV